MSDQAQRCFCGSGRPFSRCCEPYLAGKKSAPTAEALMRSRYSAFCQGNVDYLVQTHHLEHRSAGDRKSLGNSVKQTEWTNLIVVKTQKGQRKDKTGTVEFVAAYRSSPVSGAQALGVQIASDEIEHDKIEQLHERSRFVREKGHWFYTDGDRLPDYEPKRSQPCWCGSQKPFKHCHG